jgi:hypothetical protein
LSRGLHRLDRLLLLLLHVAVLELDLMLLLLLLGGLGVHSLPGQKLLVLLKIRGGWLGRDRTRGGHLLDWLLVLLLLGLWLVQPINTNLLTTGLGRWGR